MEAAAGSFFFFVETAMDFLFMIDLVLNFRTGFIRKDGSTEMNGTKCAQHYLKGYFVVDFVSSMPWDILLG